MFLCILSAAFGILWLDLDLGVRVNYISYKLFLHFLHLHVLNLRVLSFGKTLARGRVSPLEIKPNENLRSPRSRNINFSPIVVHRTPTHLTTHVSCCSCARIFCDSWQSLAYHKERNVLVTSRCSLRIYLNSSTFVDISFFSLSLHVARCDRDYKTDTRLPNFRKASYFILQLYFSKNLLKLCTKHSCFLQLCFYLSMLFH